MLLKEQVSVETTMRRLMENEEEEEEEAMVVVGSIGVPHEALG